MKILKNAGYSRILAVQPGHPKPQQIMERCGRTCYQSFKGKITDSSASKFVRMVVERTHYAVIEHGWSGFIIKDPQRKLNLYKYFWPHTKFLYITERDDNFILVSGNMEVWRKIYQAGLLSKSNLTGHLRNYCPDVFMFVTPRPTPDTLCFDGEPITSIEQLKSKEELLNHVALTIELDFVSRGLTHELVRHRPIVFAQASTRFVDYAGLRAKNPNLDRFQLKCVVPPHRDENQIVTLEDGSQKSMRDGLLDIERLYRALRKAGWLPEDARQILPNALVAQIIASAPLEEWHYIDYRRTTKAAHWEIRRVIGNSLKQRKKLFPEIFADFRKAGLDKNGLAYFEQIMNK